MVGGSLHPWPSCRATSRVEISIMGAILEDRDQSRGNFFCSWAIFKIAQRHPAANTSRPQVVNHIPPALNCSVILYSLFWETLKRNKKRQKFSQLFCWNCQPEQKTETENELIFPHDSLFWQSRHHGTSSSGPIKIQSRVLCVLTDWSSTSQTHWQKLLCLPKKKKKKKVYIFYFMVSCWWRGTGSYNFPHRFRLNWDRKPLGGYKSRKSACSTTLSLLFLSLSLNSSLSRVKWDMPVRKWNGVLACANNGRNVTRYKAQAAIKRKEKREKKRAE